MEKKSIENLVTENFLYAKVLDSFGVEFYDSRKKTLEQVCSEHDIDQSRLLAILENTTSRSNQAYLEFRDYPARLIIEYLRHVHQIFLKDTLPYLLRLVEKLDRNTGSGLIHDLKLIMPMFVEDFIHHIQEEEDGLFNYVLDMDRYLKGQCNASKVLDRQNNFSIQEFALHHNHSDDEMAGIRGITNDYQSLDHSDVQVGVLLKSLEDFDKKLEQHANIENDILFFKALGMEKKVMDKFRQNAQYN